MLWPAEFLIERNCYSRWVVSQLTAEGPSLGLTHGEGRSLVMGSAMNYTAEHLQPFVRSLRRFSNCRALLIVNNEDVAERMHPEGIDCMLFSARRGYAPHGNFARNAAYRQVLIGLRGQIDRVFFIDTRDVVFQGDPFDEAPEDEIVYFEEGRGVTFASNETNGEWAQSAFGQEIFELLKSHEVICSGTVLANYDAAVTYCWLQLLLGATVPRRRLGLPGVDQITTNIIARCVPIKGSRVVPFDGHVATLYVSPHLQAVGDGLFAREAVFYRRYFISTTVCLISFRR